MICILTEPAYSGSIWCKELFKSLTDRLRQKRIPFCEVYDRLDSENDGVFIIASDYNWIKSTVAQLNSADIKPILLCNQSEPLYGCEYSCVCSDINGSMKYLLNELKSSGKKEVALYGVNTSSFSDISRVDSLFAFKDESFNKMRIFTNEGSFENCFNSFLNAYKSFDAVICSNDFAAVSLVRNLKKRAPKALENLKILSCAQTQISEYYKKYITSLNMNFEQYGKAAVFIYEKLKAHPYMSGITITVKWNGNYEKPSTNKTVALKGDKNGYGFYDDIEMQDMLRVEKVLNSCNDTDRLIFSSLINDVTLEEIASRCFLTEGGVKYRIKRILSECGLSDKSELLELLKEYLPSVTG